ncbi:suppressor of glycerol defect [Malassezia yamatoensis]|uniref:Suppressor of glycerol defect n=1 Tax=Malassezia yamatoensis TaxID=253288 RepID=A0AAJ5YRU6_9BASI|nr:suppressor of glycerol defect [Malassezia yamatoensis]
MVWRGQTAKRKSTTRLPAALRDELGFGEEGDNKRKLRAKRPPVHSITARKELRKQRRHPKRPSTLQRANRADETKRHGSAQEEKHHKSTYPVLESENLSSRQNEKKAREKESQHSTPRPDIPRLNDDKVQATSEKVTRTILDPITGAVQHSRDLSKSKGPTKLERLAAQSERSATSTHSAKKSIPKRPLNAEENGENDEIRWLEHQLYGKKGKRNQEEGDDVDYLLDDLDRLEDTLGDIEMDSDVESGSENHLEGSHDSEEGREPASSEEDTKMDDDESETSDLTLRDTASDEIEKSDNGDTIHTEPVSSTKGDPKEDQEKVSVPATSNKYVPPAVRAAMMKDNNESHSIQQQKLRRHINGLLNRLGEGNIDTVLKEIESLFGSYARRDVTSTLTSLVLDTIAARSQLSQTFVVIYAALLTAMHRIVGVEFGAYFVQSCLDRFLDVYRQYSNSSAADEESISSWSKECVNLVFLLSHLLNLKLLSARLLYDLIRLLLGYEFREMVSTASPYKQMKELDIELVLRIVQSCGQQLRRDDSTSLTTIASLTKQRIEEASGNTDLVTDSSRAHFMLEILQNPRQDRKSDSSKDDGVKRLSRYLSTLDRRRTLRTHTALQIGLQDLKDAETKGRWWLVGAAWTGNESGIRPEKDTAEPDSGKDFGFLQDIDEPEVDVGSLARIQGMNTEARRVVFTTLVSALDYKDAVQSLLQLKLNEVQRREIIRVLIHCLGNEQLYNPYYVLIGQQLAEDLPAMRITMQYVLWDYLREIGEAHVGGEKITSNLDESQYIGTASSAGQDKLNHLSQAYGTWIGHGALSLMILRPVDFVSLQENGTRFLQRLLVYTLLATQTKAPILTAALRTQLAKPLTDANKTSVERVFVQGTVGQPTLAQGLLVFLRRHLRSRDIIQVLGKNETEAITRIRSAAKLALNTVNVGASSAEA